MKQFNRYMLLTLFGLILFGFGMNAQTTVSGTVTDEGGEPLIGASIIIQGSSVGTTTDADGSFELTTDRTPPFTIDVSYTGFATNSMEISGNARDMKITLATSSSVLDEVVVSASRRREKVQEAPASISVLGERQLRVSSQAADAARNLINVPGVQIQQQSASRINIAMRGQALMFNTSVFPIMDYRSLVGPGIGTFQTDQAGISTVDLARIEVVRGPGSALYGPGVNAGVIHFITKNPIDHPGTTVELMGGELATFGVTARHATKVSDKFGFKINAQYKRGDEFTLDNEEDAAQIAKLQKTVSQPAVTNDVVDVSKPGEVLLDESDLDEDGDGNPMQDDWNNMAVNATLEFRPQSDMSVFLSGGFNSASAVFYNSQGEGLAQNQEIWTQARFQKGGLFAQVFYVDNDGGTKDRPTFLYQTGLRTPVARQQLEGQLQYNFDVPKLLNANFTAGVDYRLAKSDTEHLVYGRRENDDDFSIFGGYLQGKFQLADKLDLVLAGRYDSFNFLDDGEFTPRVAVVYKPSPKHTFRASYNRASEPPTALNINIDFPVAAPVPGLFDLWLTGTKEAHTYTNPVIDITIPGVPDLPYGTPGLPLAIPYGAVNGAVLPALIEGLRQANPALEPFLPAIEAFLTDYSPGGVSGVLAPRNIFTNLPMTELVPTTTPQLSIYDNLEIGYKGLIADKWSVSVDLYRVKREGFTVFTAVGPTYSLQNQNIAGDLNTTVTADVTPFLFNMFKGAGLDDATAQAFTDQLAPVIGGAYAQGGEGFVAQTSPLYGIIGTVESDLIPQGDGITHVTAGYRSFGDASIEYWGSDIGVEYYVDQDISIFANYSWTSTNRWGPGAEDTEDAESLAFPFSLNTPKNKYRLGVNWTPAQGWMGMIAFQHDDSFYGDFGQFAGDTDEVNVVDLTVGYTFASGLQFSAAATNLLDNEYRAFPNFPKIGRRVLLKALYNF